MLKGLERARRREGKIRQRFCFNESFCRKILFATVLCCFAGGAKAALSTLTETVSVGEQFTDFSKVPVRFQQFDPGLGKLSSVEIILQATGDMTQEYENTSKKKASKQVHQQFNMTLTLPGKDSSLSVRQNENHKYSEGPFDGQIDFGGTSGVTESYDIMASNQKLLHSKSDLAMFTGSSLEELFLSGKSVFSVPNFDNNSIIQAKALAGADITIIYNYMAVPEPVWFGVLAGSAAVFVAWRRGTQKKRQP